MATNLNVITDSTKVEAIKKAIGGSKQEMRVLFADIESAEKTFIAATKEAGDSVPALRPMRPIMAEVDILNDKGKPTGEKRQEPTGEYEPDDSVFDGMQIAVAVVGARKKNDSTGKMDSGVKAVVMFPIPSTETFLKSEAGTDWVAKVIEKEAAHVAFRGLRNSETIEEIRAEFDSMPRDVDTFVTSARGEGLDTDTFDAAWLPLRAQIKAEAPELADMLPTKAEVLRAIRSKAYAEQSQEELESNGVFVWLGKSLIAFADNWKDEKGELAPLDSSAIKEWIEGRDTLDLSKAEKPKDFSALASLKEKLGF